jgi:CRISPR type I-E-associated protein CasB/Cse2
MSVSSETRQTSYRGRVREAVQRIARELEQEVITSGDRAALRRIQPGEAGAPAFWKIAIRHLEPAGLLADVDGPLRQWQEMYWSTALSAMAEGPPLGRRSFGRALAETGVAEARVLRLLRAHEEVLLATVRTVTHQLDAAGCAFDWSDIVELMSSDGSPYAEAVRRRIAYDYYRQERLTEKKTMEERE